MLLVIRDELEMCFTHIIHIGFETGVEIFSHRIACVLPIGFPFGFGGFGGDFGRFGFFGGAIFFCCGRRVWILGRRRLLFGQQFDEFEFFHNRTDRMVQLVFCGGECFNRLVHRIHGADDQLGIFRFLFFAGCTLRTILPLCGVCPFVVAAGLRCVKICLAQVLALIVQFRPVGVHLRILQHPLKIFVRFLDVYFRIFRRAPSRRQCGKHLPFAVMHLFVQLFDYIHSIIDYAADFRVHSFHQIHERVHGKIVEAETLLVCLAQHGMQLFGELFEPQLVDLHLICRTFTGFFELSYPFGKGGLQCAFPLVYQLRQSFEKLRRFSSFFRLDRDRIFGVLDSDPESQRNTVPEFRHDGSHIVRRTSVRLHFPIFQPFVCNLVESPQGIFIPCVFKRMDKTRHDQSVAIFRSVETSLVLLEPVRLLVKPELLHKRISLFEILHQAFLHRFLGVRNVDVHRLAFGAVLFRLLKV